MVEELLNANADPNIETVCLSIVMVCTLFNTHNQCRFLVLHCLLQKI